MDKTISWRDTNGFASTFEGEPRNRLAMNAITKNGVGSVALNRDVVSRVDHTYSHLVDTPKATNQKRSGRCWIFAGLNMLRLAALEALNVKEFELSQSYLMFWDKLEKANHFLESIIETCEEPLDGRLVMWLLADPIADGGQWDMLVNLIEKYGVVPKVFMPETKSSSNTRAMNASLVNKLREAAWRLREAHAKGATPGQLREIKADVLSSVYTMLSVHLGRPPKSFLWEWRDKENVFTRRGVLTPQQFYQEYVGLDLDNYVCLINAPTDDKPYKALYTVEYLGNVVGGRIVRYLNVGAAPMKQAASDMITGGHVVWFGCDVGKMLDRDLGVLDLDLFDYSLVYGASFELGKADRLDYGQSRMTHAMVLTAVDLCEDGRPVKWRVENSWGTEHGDEGYLLMTDSWFDEYVYEVTVSKDVLPDDLLAVLDTEPTVLPPWDPMGALARAR